MKLEKLAPAFQGYLWGGTKLRDVYGKQCDLPKVAESWELSTHPAGECRISGGEFDGLTLEEYAKRAGNQVLGTNTLAFDRFPVLIKLIDAKDPLSIQVHPSDEYALKVEGEYGKTELWYVMDCEPGAYLYFGVNRPVTKEEFRRRIQDNTVLEVLNRVEVHPGDVFFIQAGTIHTIGAGMLICEIQQNSNCAYRLYDYGRVGADGKPRELHIAKAFEVADTTAVCRPGEGVKQLSDGVELLGACRYFTAVAYDTARCASTEVGERSFSAFTCVDGECTVTVQGYSCPLRRGDTCFVPAGAGEVAFDGNATLIEAKV